MYFHVLNIVCFRLYIRSWGFILILLRPILSPAHSSNGGFEDVRGTEERKIRVSWSGIIARFLYFVWGQELLEGFEKRCDMIQLMFERSFWALFLEDWKRGRQMQREQLGGCSNHPGEEDGGWTRVVAVEVESHAQTLERFWRLNWQDILMGSEGKRWVKDDSCLLFPGNISFLC